ncbi:MAG: hypothetical protein WBV82_06845 [Myxococcaceae bacterium]
MKKHVAAMCLVLLPLTAANAAPEIASSVDAPDVFDSPTNMLFVHPDWSTLRGVGVTWMSQLSPVWALHIEATLGGRTATQNPSNISPDVGYEERSFDGKLLAGVDLLPLGVAKGGPLLGARLGGRVDHTEHGFSGGFVQPGSGWKGTTWMGTIGARAGYLARFDFGLALQAAVGLDAGYSRTSGGWDFEPSTSWSEAVTSLTPAIELGVGWAF